MASDSVTKKVRTLRNMKFSGASLAEEGPATGFSPGIKGYHEVVRYVYRLFGEKDVDEAALCLGGAPPRRSCALSVVPSSIEDYQAELWDKCIDNAQIGVCKIHLILSI